VYLLTEQVKISKDRVNAIDSDITGGYLIELDRNPNVDPEDYYFNIYDTPYNLKEPEETSNERKEYIENYMKDAFDALYSSNFKDINLGYQKYIDVDSFIDWYLVNEILKNADAANYSSIFFHKSAGQKLKMGPLWDFDLAIGN